MDRETKLKMIAMAKESVNQFNKGREIHPELKIDLAQADFSDCDLQGINFSNVSLGMCSFIGANLQDADLSGANFFKSRLIEANMQKAKMDGANVAFADFTGADLKEASMVNLQGLQQSKFHKCDLRGAILTGSYMPEQVSYQSKFGKVAFKSTLSGIDKVKSRLQFISGVLIIIFAVAIIIVGGWYLFLKFTIKEGQNPAHVMQSKLLYYRAMFSIRREDYKNAELQMKKAIKLNPNEPKYLITYGEALAGLQKYKEAKHTFQECADRAKTAELQQIAEKRVQDMNVKMNLKNP